MSPSFGPCDWPFPEREEGSDACLDCEAIDTLSEPEQARVKRMAVELLWAWSGRRFGLCETTLMPCHEKRPSTAGLHGLGPAYALGIPQIGGWSPALIGGQWYNLRCGVCSNRCHCSLDDMRAIELPGNVASITEILIDGLELPESAYRLHPGGLLLRVDGGVWPASNDFYDDPREAGSLAWSITYQRGEAVPDGGQIAAELLACEIAKALCNDKSCQLPQRVQSITRQGVTLAVVDPFEGLDEGRTGIWEIDAWLAAVNAAQPAMPGVFSPDKPRSARGRPVGGLFGGF